MPPVRPSMLQLAEACTYAPVLAARFPTSNVHAEGGKTDHAEIAEALRARRTPEDERTRRAVEWLRGFTTEDSRLFVETAVALRDPGTDELLTEGTPDAQVVRPDGTLITIDWKGGWQGSLPDPDDSLQLHGYSLARAIADGCKRYQNIYVRLDPFLVVTSRVFERHAWWEPLRRIQAIVRRDVAATTGPHCFDCYHRTRCEAWLLPAYEGPTALAPYTVPGGLTAESAPRALEALQALKDVVELADQVVKDYARKHGGIVSADGKKVWAPTQVAGRKSVDVEALERDGLGDKYIRNGAPFWRFGWRKR